MHIQNRKNYGTLAIVVVVLSNILLGIGLFAPAMVIKPAYGQLSGVVEAIQPTYLTPSSYSIVSALYELFMSGSWFIASVVLIFSVLFPLWKLGVLWSCLGSLKDRREIKRQLRLIESLGKFSMLDIFVMALIVLSIKGLPGGTEVQLKWGVPTFAISVVLAMLAPQILIRSRE